MGLQYGHLPLGTVGVPTPGTTVGVPTPGLEASVSMPLPPCTRSRTS